MLKVGLTYDLRQDYLNYGYSVEEVAEFDSPDTIDAIDGVLQQRGYHVVRIGNVRSLAKRLMQGESWDFVFNICEGLHGIAREAQVPALLDAFGIPYTFSDPLIMALTLDKAMAKRVVRDFGSPTAPFVVIDSVAQIAAVALPFPLFAKPLAEGTGKGINAQSYITSQEQLATQCRLLLERYHQPVLIEPFLPGREFTVGLLGTGAAARSIGVLEVKLREGAEPYAQSFANKEACEQFIDYVLVDDAEAERAAAVALKVWRDLGCRDAGRIDLRSDASGSPHFLEVNPLAGLHPTHSDLPNLATQIGMKYEELIFAIVDSCLQHRVGSSKVAQVVAASAGATPGDSLVVSLFAADDIDFAAELGNRSQPQ